MKNDRYTRIVELVNEKGKVSVNDLSNLLGVSATTIRKDLDYLSSKGLLSREHGFAIEVTSDDVGKRVGLKYDIKLKIAAAGAETISNGETVMIESGSTCSLLASEIAKSGKFVTIVTNSAYIADLVSSFGNITIILLGGIYQKESRVTVGPMLRDYAKQFRVDKLFIGTDGFDMSSGFTANNIMRIEAMRMLAESATNVFVMTDSSKFTSLGVLSQLRFDETGGVFTDSGIPADALDTLKRHGVPVIAV